VQSAVLRSHVVCLSVRPSVSLSVTLVDCHHIGWNSSEIISPLVSWDVRSRKPKHQGSIPRGTLGNFGPKWTTPCWFERRRHSIANCGRMVTDSATVTMESLYRKPPSLFRMAPSLTPYDLPFPQIGIPYAPKLREWPYLRNGWSDTLHGWF